MNELDRTVLPEEELLELREALSSLKEDVPPMPEDFHQAWTARIEEDAMHTEQTRLIHRKNLTRILSIAAAMVFVIGGTMLTRDELNTAAPESGVSKASLYGLYEESGYAEDSGMVMMGSYDAAAPTMGSGAARSMKSVNTSNTAVREQKIIRSASLTIGTQQYDETLASLKQLCEDQGGWISYSSENLDSQGNRRAYLTLRIPTANLDACLAGSSSLGRVTSREESATDVTDSYYDTRARLDTQLALMDRLQALVTDAASLSDLLALESQIADTQYMIDSYQSSLDNTDQQVNYATLSINLREENPSADITDGDKSLGERLISALEAGAEAFVEFMADMVVFLAAALPFIAIVAVVWILVRVVRKLRKK